MKNITTNTELTRSLKGGSATLIIAGMAIAAPYAGIAWEIGKGLGTIIGNKLFKR